MCDLHEYTICCMLLDQRPRMQNILWETETDMQSWSRDNDFGGKFCKILASISVITANDISIQVILQLTERRYDFRKEKNWR